MTLHFRRNGIPYNPTEAIDSDGTVRDGEWVRVPLILKDRLASGLITFRDATAAKATRDRALAARYGGTAPHTTAPVSIETTAAIRDAARRSRYQNTTDAAPIASTPAAATDTAAIRDQARRNRYATADAATAEAAEIGANVGWRS